MAMAVRGGGAEDQGGLGARLRTVPSRDASPMPMTSRMERQGMSVSARSTVKGMSVLML